MRPNGEEIVQLRASGTSLLIPEGMQLWLFGNALFPVPPLTSARSVLTGARELRAGFHAWDCQLSQFCWKGKSQWLLTAGGGNMRHNAASKRYIYLASANQIIVVGAF